jgi:hypothetical protein
MVWLGHDLERNQRDRISDLQSKCVEFMQKLGAPMTYEPKKEQTEGTKSVQSGLDDLHDRIQSRLDELNADFKQLGADVREARQSGLRARKDRIEGFKRALRDILQAADQADREWH